MPTFTSFQIIVQAFIFYSFLSHLVDLEAIKGGEEKLLFQLQNLAPKSPEKSSYLLKLSKFEEMSCLVVILGGFGGAKFGLS